MQRRVPLKERPLALSLVDIFRPWNFEMEAPEAMVPNHGIHIEQADSYETLR
jgi:hypothetical protein